MKLRGTVTHSCPLAPSRCQASVCNPTCMYKTKQPRGNSTRVAVVAAGHSHTQHTPKRGTHHTHATRTSQEPLHNATHARHARPPDSTSASQHSMPQHAAGREVAVEGTHTRQASKSAEVMSKAQQARSKKPVGRPQDKTPREQGTSTSASNLTTKIALLSSIWDVAHTTVQGSRQRGPGNAAAGFLLQHPHSPKPRCNKEAHRGIHTCNACAQHTPDTRTLVHSSGQNQPCGRLKPCTPFCGCCPPTHHPAAAALMMLHAAPRDHPPHIHHRPDTTHTHPSSLLQELQRRRPAPGAAQPSPPPQQLPPLSRVKNHARGVLPRQQAGPLVVLGQGAAACACQLCACEVCVCQLHALDVVLLLHQELSVLDEDVQGHGRLLEIDLKGASERVRE